MRPEEEIDEDALSYGYVRADLEHRLRIWDPGPPAPVYLVVLCPRAPAPLAVGRIGDGGRHLGRVADSR